MNSSTLLKAIPLVLVAALATACTSEDLDYFQNGPRDGSYQAGPPAGGSDSFYQQQNAAREANMRAVREQDYRNQMQSYQNGYRSSLPNY